MKVRMWIMKNLKPNKNFVIPVISAAIFGLTVACCSSLSYGLAIECNGKKIATVPNEEIYEQANKLIKTELMNSDDDMKKEEMKNIVKSEVKLEPVVANECCKSVGDVRNKIIKESNSDIAEGAGLCINDKLIDVGKNTDEINNVLNSILESEKEKFGSTDVTAEFVQKIEVLPGLYDTEDIVDINEIENHLKHGIEKTKEYTVSEGDTITGIAEKFEITIEKLLEMNGKTEPSIFVGEVLKIKFTEKVLDIKITKTENIEEKIPFSLLKTEDNNLVEGQEVVTQKGEEGIKKTILATTFINSIETLKEKISSEVLREPINEHIKIGTKKQEQSYTNSGPTDGKSMVWPVPSSHKVSSPFGDTHGRGRSHKGIDISGKKGAAILAVQSGTVEIAGYGERGYGIQVKINHGNGLCTRYAHCGSVSVKKGEYVSAGSKIAAIGLTGDTSGYHLHAEVIQNGVHKNPRNYF